MAGFSQANYNSNKVSAPTPPAGAIQASTAGAGYDSNNATNAFYAAVTSSNQNVVIDNVGGAPTVWKIDPKRIVGVNNKNIWLEEGVTLTHITNSLNNTGTDTNGNNLPNDPNSVIQFMSCTNIKIYGYGATVELHRAELSGENSHAVQSQGCNGFEVYGLTITGVGFGQGGDGVNIKNNNSNVSSRNVILKDLIVDNHSRQGLSVTGVDGLIVDNCVFSGTNGRFPRCGIDFEPNDSSGLLLDMVVRNTTLANNGANGIVLAIRFANSIASTPHGQFEDTAQTRRIELTVDNCLFDKNAVDVGDNGTGPVFTMQEVDFDARFTAHKGLNGYVNIINSEFISIKHAIAIGKRPDAYDFNITDTTISMESGHDSPFLSHDGTWNDRRVGGIVVSDVVLNTSNNSPLLEISGYGGRMNWKDFTGNILLNGPTTNSIRYVSGSTNQSLTENFNVLFGSAPPVTIPATDINILSKKRSNLITYINT